MYSNSPITFQQFTLAGWLQQHNPQNFKQPSTLHIFLFLYQCMMPHPHFNQIQYHNQLPIFPAMQAMQQHHPRKFTQQCHTAFMQASNQICQQQTKLINFFMQTCTPTELTQIIRQMDICQQHTQLSTRDQMLIQTIQNLYPVTMIDQSQIIHLNQKIFIISKQDYQQLTPQHQHTIHVLSQDPQLANPIHLMLHQGTLCFH